MLLPQLSVAVQVRVKGVGIRAHSVGTNLTKYHSHVSCRNYPKPSPQQEQQVRRRTLR
jgi:hypothetical protein